MMIIKNKEKQMQKSQPIGLAFSSYLMLSSSLLSHGETPHYHRRYGVSLLSSAWDQVGPPRYGRQAEFFKFCNYSSHPETHPFGASAPHCSSLFQTNWSVLITRYLLLSQSITSNLILNKLTSSFRLSDNTLSLVSG